MKGSDILWKIRKIVPSWVIYLVLLIWIAWVEISLAFSGPTDPLAMAVTEPPAELAASAETEGNVKDAASPLGWWTSRDPATAVLELDLRPWGFFGGRVQTYRAGLLLEDHQSETISNQFQVVCSDPAHAVGWIRREVLPAWMDEVRITLYPWPEMLLAPSDRRGTTYTFRR
jgi:hypothetical protein